MQYIIDSANIEKIKEIVEYYPIDGITTNPTIISKEKTNFYQLITELKSIIGPKKMFHIQTTASEVDDIVEEAKRLRDLIGENFFIKIPISAAGLKATEICKENGINVTMTAIFTQQQALIGSKAGANYVAPYVNRLDNVVSDGVNVVKEIVDLFDIHKIDSCKVLAASFKTVEQIHKVALVGGHAVTINPDMYKSLVYHPLSLYAIDDFEHDWESVYGKKTIIELLNEKQ